MVKLISVLFIAVILGASAASASDHRGGNGFEAPTAALVSAGDSAKVAGQ